MNPTKITNHTLLILTNKIKTESNLERISKIKNCNQETLKFCREWNTYLTNTIKNVEASVAWSGFIWFILKDMEVHDKYGALIWRFTPTQWQPWWIHNLTIKTSQRIWEYNN